MTGAPTLDPPAFDERFFKHGLSEWNRRPYGGLEAFVAGPRAAPGIALR
jgi:hypothetical protein